MNAYVDLATRLDRQNASERAREDRARRQARGQGYAVKKSRVRNPHLDDFGGYRIIDPYLNAVVAGARFELTLEDVEDWLDS